MLAVSQCEAEKMAIWAAPNNATKLSPSCTSCGTPGVYRCLLKRRYHILKCYRLRTCPSLMVRSSHGRRCSYPDASRRAASILSLECANMLHMLSPMALRVLGGGYCNRLKRMMAFEGGEVLSLARSEDRYLKILTTDHSLHHAFSRQASIAEI